MWSHITLYRYVYIIFMPTRSGIIHHRSSINSSNLSVTSPHSHLISYTTSLVCILPNDPNTDNHHWYVRLRPIYVRFSLLRNRKPPVSEVNVAKISISQFIGTRCRTVVKSVVARYKYMRWKRISVARLLTSIWTHPQSAVHLYWDVDVLSVNRQLALGVFWSTDWASIGNRMRTLRDLPKLIAWKIDLVM